MNYDNALIQLNLDTLADRREKISQQNSNDSTKYNTMSDLLNKKDGPR